MTVIFHRHVSSQASLREDATARRVATGSLRVEYLPDGISVTLDLRMLTLTGAVNLPVADDTGTQIKARIASEVVAVLVRKRVLGRGVVHVVERVVLRQSSPCLYVCRCDAARSVGQLRQDLQLGHLEGPGGSYSLGNL
jgi:hypothetical protein